MTLSIALQLGLYLLILLLLVKPLGAHMARVYQGERTFLTPALNPVERFIYRLARIRPDEEMDWKAYALAMLLFNLAGFILLYLLQRLQSVLPLNPERLASVPPDLAFNASASFVTNTNWQSYSGETTMSYLTKCWVYRTEFSLGGYGYGSVDCAGTFFREAVGQGHWQFLGGYYSKHSIHTLASGTRVSRGFRIAGRGPDIQWTCQRLHVAVNS